VPDIAIRNTTVQAAPKDYTVSGAQELLTKAVRAAIDGSGAASGYLPCLELLDSNGNVMWAAVSGTTLAAGVSANVTWFPDIGATGSGGGGSLTVYHGGAAVGTEPGIDIVDSSTVSWTITDEPVNSWVKLIATAQGTSTSGQAPGSYTWTNPGTGIVNVICVGAGGGGGSGDQANPGATGGGGGGGGCVIIWSGPAAILPATVGYTIGAGGAGGTAGTDGTVGGASFFGAPAIVFAGGGGGGGGDAAHSGGTSGGGGGNISSASGSGGTGNPPAGGSTFTQVDGTGYQGVYGSVSHHSGNNNEWGGAGGAGGSDNAQNAPGAGSSLHGGPGGGGGGTNAGGDTQGSDGGTHAYTVGGGGAHGTPGADGNQTPAPYTGTGGGGGSYVAASNGSAGGKGGPGAGGGGGSVCDAGFVRGPGGKGGDGAVYIFIT